MSEPQQYSSSTELIDADTRDTAAAINAGIALGDPKKNPAPHGGHYAIVPPGAKLEMLPEPGVPPRCKGTVKLSDTASFLEYWKRQSDAASYIYGSMQPIQFLAVFNEHGKELPDWRDHRALYTLQHSDEWNVWMKHNGQPFDGNEGFALWLEEQLLDIVTPEPAVFMDVALNMRVRQGQTFSKKVNLNDGNIVFEYANLVEGSGGASPTGESLKIPERFEISIPVFKGLDAPKYMIEARFRYRLSGSALKIQYELIRPAKVMEQAFKSMLDTIQTEAKTLVLFGLPE
jgi:uncharacterized protein YfdQ (DUF2303 family)